MNREIKFRAWSIIMNDHKMFYDVQHILRDDGYWWMFNDGMRLYQTGDRCIIMQFTGLLDKNGKEIYEGDIVKESISTGGISERKYGFVFGVVMYVSASFLMRPFYYTAGIQSVFGDGKIYGSADRRLFIESEIIGNIHENPELLQKQINN